MMNRVNLRADNIWRIVSFRDLYSRGRNKLYDFVSRISIRLDRFKRFFKAVVWWLERATLYVFSRPFKISSRRITSNGNRSSSSRVSYEETRWMKGCCVIYYRFPQKYVHRVFTTLTSLFRIGYGEGNDEFIWMRYAVGCNFNQVNYRELFFQSCKQVCFHCFHSFSGWLARRDEIQPNLRERAPKRKIDHVLLLSAWINHNSAWEIYPSPPFQDI